jgi:cell division protein FtsZ
VLHGAVAGIAEIISCPGMINVDFADVRTVMAEMGMAMMGSAKAAGPDRARARGRAGRRLPAARGHQHRGCARRAGEHLGEPGHASAAGDVRRHGRRSRPARRIGDPIIGAVYDDALEDQLRVTIVATGLGKTAVRQQTSRSPWSRSKTGTDNQPAESTTARSRCRP